MWYKEKISNLKPNPNNPRIIKDDIKAYCEIWGDFRDKVSTLGK